MLTLVAISIGQRADQVHLGLSFGPPAEIEGGVSQKSRTASLGPSYVFLPAAFETFDMHRSVIDNAPRIVLVMMSTWA